MMGRNSPENRANLTPAKGLREILSGLYRRIVENGNKYPLVVPLPKSRRRGLIVTDRETGEKRLIEDVK